MPQCPFLNLDDTCLLVDANEIYRIYTELAADTLKEASGHSGGRLGFVNSHQAVLEIDFEVAPEDLAEVSLDDADMARGRDVRHHRGRIKKGKQALKAVPVSVSIAQDLGALRNRKGDTGEQFELSIRLCTQKSLT